MGRKMRSPTIHCTRKRPYHSKRCSTCAAWQREWSAARVHQPPLRKGPQEDVPDPRRPARLTTTTEYRITTCHGRRTRRCRLSTNDAPHRRHPTHPLTPTPPPVRHTTHALWSPPPRSSSTPCTDGSTSPSGILLRVKRRHATRSDVRPPSFSPRTCRRGAHS